MKRVALVIVLIFSSTFFPFEGYSAGSGTLVRTVAKKAQSALLPLSATHEAIPGMVGRVIEERMIPSTLGAVFIGQRTGDILTEETFANAVVRTGNVNDWLKTWQVGGGVSFNQKTISFSGLVLDAEAEFLSIMMMLANSGNGNGISNAYFAAFEALLSSTTWAINRSTALKTKRLNQFASAALFIDKVTDTEVQAVLLDESFLNFAKNSGLSDDFLARLKQGAEVEVDEALGLAQLDISDAFFSDGVLNGTEIPVRSNLNELVGNFVSTFFHLIDDLSKADKRELRVNMEKVAQSIVNIMFRAGSIEEGLWIYLKESPGELLKLPLASFNQPASFPVNTIRRF